MRFSPALCTRLSQAGLLSKLVPSASLSSARRPTLKPTFFQFNALSSLLAGRSVNASSRLRTSLVPSRLNCTLEMPVLDRLPKMLDSCDLALTGDELTSFGHTILTDVPENVTVTPMDGPIGCSGVFLGARFDSAKSRHVFPIGTLRNLRFLCCYRFKLWWMTQRVGSNGKDVPNETQFLLLESDRDSQSPNEPVYFVMLPLVDGSFRAAIQGSSDNMLEVCSESGDPDVRTFESTKAVFVNAGRDPYKLLNESIRSLEKHSGNFQHREKKTLPGFVNYFGWCTWDAFYTDVDKAGIRKGLSSLAEGGVPAKFLIIDDGWQAVAADFHTKATLTPETQHFSRLVDVKPNEKFHCADEQEACANGRGNLQGLVTSAKEDYGLKYVYVWHALMGYWGGVNPTAASTQKFLAALKYPDFSPSVLDKPDTVLDLITKHGLGVIGPSKIHEFYNEMHSYLASCGVDGVKVDVQSMLELVGGGHGGRVEIARAYHTALEASVAKNFKENGVIACMSHNTDGIYMTKRTAVVRASDDFWPNDPASHTIHLLAVAYNSMFLGEFMQPDWDMFHSLHPAAEFHAAARAVGGCPVYVSDKPGQHNFEVLRKLVLHDGSILRARLPGRPTRDCLFVDTARDGRSLLKVWNINSCNGVLGAFNCQGAAWCKDSRKYKFHNSESKELAGTICAADIEGLEELAGADWEGDVAIYSHNSGELVDLPRGASLVTILKRLEFEIFTVSPIQRAGHVKCAPIGLADMYNSGGAVLSTSTHQKNFPAATSSLHWMSTCVKGSGRFIAYASTVPAECCIDGEKAQFTYDQTSGQVELELPWSAKGNQVDLLWQ